MLVDLPDEDEAVERVARKLYEREYERANHCGMVLSEIAGKRIIDRMEAWEDCKATFLGDAKAVIELLSAPTAKPSLVGGENAQRNLAERGIMYYQKEIDIFYEGYNKADAEFKANGFCGMKPMIGGIIALTEALTKASRRGTSGENDGHE